MRVLPPIGRLLFSFIFVASGLNHLTHVPQTAAMVKGAGLPAPAVLSVLAGLFLLLGGLFVLFGALTRIGAAMLFVFLVVAAFTMHRFWTETDAMAAQMQMANFMKNIALAGASLLLMYFGPGTFALDTRRRSHHVQAPVLRPRHQE